MIEWALSLFAVSAAASARWNWWRRKGAGLPILMYHKIGRAPKESKLKKLWVTAEDFRWQMGYLKRHGYAPITFSDLEDARTGKKPLPPNPVMVTFDDGYQNNYTAAYPILLELGIKANLFLVYETVDRHNAWHDPKDEPWLRMLTWSQVREMRSSRLFDVANHTMRHSCLTEIPLEQARWEVSEAKKRLEDTLGNAVPAFAYPYGAGAYDPRVREAVLEAGHTLDFGIRQGLSPWPPAEPAGPLQRLLIRGDDGMLDFHLNVTRGKSRF